MTTNISIPVSDRHAFGRRGLWSLASSAAALATAAAVLPALAATTNPDAELIRLCAEYTAADRALIQNGFEMDNYTLNSPEEKAHSARGHEAVDRMHELEELIEEIVPQTREGLLAKAEAARRSLISNGDDDEEGELFNYEAALAYSVLESLLGRVA